MLNMLNENNNNKEDISLKYKLLVLVFECMGSDTKSFGNFY